MRCDCHSSLCVLCIYSVYLCVELLYKLGGQAVGLPVYKLLFQDVFIAGKHVPCCHYMGEYFLNGVVELGLWLAGSFLVCLSMTF